MTLGRIIIIRDDRAPAVLAMIDCPHTHVTLWPDSRLYVCHDCGRTIEYKRQGQDVRVEPAKAKRPECLKPWCGVDEKLCVDCAPEQEKEP